MLGTLERSRPGRETVPATTARPVAARQQVVATGQAPQGPQRRWLAFDGLRGVAIAMVLADHSRFRWAAGGWIAVDIYFALSGFLITWLVLGEWDRYGSVSLKRFWQRRVYRLLPLLVAVLAGTALFASAIPVPTKGQTLVGIPTSLFFVSNLYTAATDQVIGLLTPTWSLGIEAQFYLAWPLLLVGLLRLGLSRRHLVVATLALALSALALAPLLFDPARAVSAYVNPAPRAGALFLGCAVALVYLGPLGERLRQRRAALGLATLMATGVLAGLFATPFDRPGIWRGGGLALVDLAAATIVAGLAVGGVPVLSKLLASPPLVFLGRISYALFLVHYPIFLGLWHYNLGLGVVAAHWGLSLAAAVACHYAIELPFLRLKARLSRVPDLAPIPVVAEAAPDRGRHRGPLEPGVPAPAPAVA